MESFGKFLIRRGFISAEGLEEATHAMVVVGGRLGTNAVDLGYLGVQVLDGYLAEYYEIEPPPELWLRQPDPAALQVVPIELLRRHRVLPLAIQEATLHLAMVDPYDPVAIDEVRFASGLPVHAYVISEVHMYFLRERHAGIERTGRFVYLDPEWARAPQPKKTRRKPAKPQAESQEVDAVEKNRAKYGIGPLGSNEELTDSDSILDTRWELAGPVAPASEASADPVPETVTELQPLMPAEVVRLERELETATDRTLIAESALGLACLHTRVAGLFVVHKGMIRGFQARGAIIDERIGGVLLAGDSRSVVARAASGEEYRGSPPTEGIDDALFDALGRRDACEMAVLPIQIGHRVLNVLYVDNGPDPLGETAMAALRSLCECVARAYARLIQARRQKHC